MPSDRADHELSLIVDGKKFGGWLDVRVTRGIERACGSFEVKATQKWPGLAAHFAIPEGAACQIYIGDDLVLTGWVDVVDAKRRKDSASLGISGRSKTGDLVDCSPDLAEVDMAGLDLAGVARKICAPFGIEVVAENTGPVFPVASAHHGESCWKLIERLARQRKMLVMDDPEGRLVLAQLGSERAADRLVHPADGLVEIGWRRDMSGRFSDYIVKAQAGGRWADAGSTSGGGGDGELPSALAHVEGRFRDPGVTRYRPKVILSEGAAKKEGAGARAEWECRRNIGKSLRVHGTRVWWRQSDDSLWRPNLLIPCELPDLNLSAELAIAEVHYQKSDQGTLTHLELAPPEAFTPEPPEAPAGTGGEGLRWGDVGSAA